jgi:hypothetical protein
MAVAVKKTRGEIFASRAGRCFEFIAAKLLTYRGALRKQVHRVGAVTSSCGSIHRQVAKNAKEDKTEEALASLSKS